MKKIFFTVLVLLSCSTLYAVSKGQPLDKIVAIVNDEVVTKSELNQSYNLFKMQSAQDPNATYSSDDKLRKQALDQLINKKLQLQLAKQAGVKITDDDLNKAIANVAKTNHISTETLYDKLKEEGVNKEDYRKEMRDQLVMRKLQQLELANKVTITPEEVSSYLRTLAHEKSTPREFQIFDVIVPFSDSPTPDEIVHAQKRADKVAEQLKQGKDISDIAKAETNVPTTLQSEDLGFRRIADFPSAFTETVRNLSVKEVSKPIQTGNGYHILQLLAVKSDTSTRSATRAQAQELLLERKYTEAMQTWLSKMRSQAYIVMNS